MSEDVSSSHQLTHRATDNAVYQSAMATTLATYGGSPTGVASTVLIEAAPIGPDAEGCSLPTHPDDAATGSFVVPGSPTPTPLRSKTRLQSGIVKLEQFTDGPIRWCNSCATGEGVEPSTV
jgi:hypothetical protein